MKLIIDQLKECIRSHPAVVNSSIGTAQKWKRTQCIILSQIISENLAKSEFLKGAKKTKLGTTISGMTLQRIFNDAYTEKENPDLRFMKTLDKLAIFIGYPSLNSFLASSNSIEITPAHKETNDLTAVFEKLIFNYCQESFKCLQNLPLINYGELSNYVFEDGPLKKRIKKALTKYSQHGVRINNIENTTTFTITDFNCVTIDNDLMVISAKESWNFEWKSSSLCESKSHRKTNKQSYFLKQKDGIWKIWDNHNPDYKELLTEVEKTAALSQPVSV